MGKTRIAILGGGYGGIEAAKVLSKKYKKNDAVEITIIDKNTYHTLMTELHEVAGSRVEPDAVMVSYERIFSGRKVNVVTDFITDIDFEKRTLISDKTEYGYDYLILSTGEHLSSLILRVYRKTPFPSGRWRMQCASVSILKNVSA